MSAKVVRAKASVEFLLNPRSIAVVGASQDPGKLGTVLLKNVLEAGFQGEVYPVNPGGGQILGKKVYPSVKEIPGAPDLMLVSIPSRGVPDVISAGAEIGVRSAVILASAFAEMGEKGKELQASVLDICAKAGMRLLGPNCMGIYNIDSKLNGTYFWDIPKTPGNVAFVSQSGAYGGMLFSQVRARNFGIRKFISIGNQCDLGHADFCEYLLEDELTRVVALFVEEVKNPQRFLKACSLLSRKKPVVVFKVGKTKAGKRATISHTGSMAGDWTVFAQAIRQCGGFLAGDTEEFFDAICMFSAYPDARLRPHAAAIITISGGPCVAAGDACEESGIPVPELTAPVQRMLRRFIPEFGASRNPVDMTPQMNPDNFPDAISTVFESKQIGGVVAVNVGLDKPQFADGFVHAKERFGKPVTAFLVDDPEISRRFAEANIPLFPSPERAAHALSFLVDRESLKREALKFKMTISNDYSLNTDAAPAPEDEARRILKGIPFCKEAIVNDERSARNAARRIGFPVVVKTAGSGPHKTDRGGVIVGVEDEKQLTRAVRDLKRKFPKGKGYVVQEFVRGELELIFGARVDPTFGPYVLFGLGGIFTEFVMEFVIRLCPLSEDQAEGMVRRSPFYRLLRGARGLPAVDLRSVAGILTRLSQIITSDPRIMEIDINPVIVRNGRLVAVDSLVTKSN
jgi:acetyltransferase